MTIPAHEPQPGPTVTEEAHQEIDVWWGGYAGRAMMPSFAGCLLLTLGFIGAATLLWNEHVLRDSQARWLTYHLNIILWLIQFARWGHRKASYEYRLTTQRLFCLRGWAKVAPQPVRLATVRTVRVEQASWQRWLDVGDVVVEAEGRSEPVVLEGVRGPGQVAEVIERQVRAAQPSPSILTRDGRN